MFHVDQCRAVKVRLFFLFSKLDSGSFSMTLVHMKKGHTGQFTRGSRSVKIIGTRVKTLHKLSESRVFYCINVTNIRFLDSTIRL